MIDYGYPELPPLAIALQRLKRTRSRELWLRAALWTWCAVVFVWLVPLGSWSAVRLPVYIAILVAVVLTGAGAVLALTHRQTSRMAAVQAAISAARDQNERRAEIRIRGVRS